MSTTPATFEHEALLYKGLDGFIQGVAPFVADGLASGDAVLVVVDRGKIDALERALGSKADDVRFEDMHVVGRNPGRIIPAWQDFLDTNEERGRRIRGVGEPIWPDRTAAELAECQRHEALLNVAFDGGPAWSLLCPYDIGALTPAVIDEAAHNHPTLLEDGDRRSSPSSRPTRQHAAPFAEALVDPPADARSLEITTSDEVHATRAFCSDLARALGFSDDRAADVALVVGELTSNSIRHAGAAAQLTAWSSEGALICEVRDAGRISDPLAGRRRPPVGAIGGRGLWMANQLSDLVQQRSVPDGNIVRVHFLRPAVTMSD